MQEALISAATTWSADGLPGNPLGWLVVVANRRMSDLFRNEVARRRREGVSTARDLATGSPSVPDQDDTLTLLFMCAHPALTPASAIPLTLRAVAGLSTAEIARAFHVPETTMAQRISRAKQRIKASQVPFALPTGDEWAHRTRSVLHVLYLLFTEGYSASSGALVARAELERSKRRSISAKYGAEIRAEDESLDRDGKGGCRVGGFYSSLISEWRRQRDKSALGAPGEAKGRMRADPVERESAECAQRATKRLNRGHRACPCDGGLEPSRS